MYEDNLKNKTFKYSIKSYKGNYKNKNKNKEKKKHILKKENIHHIVKEQREARKPESIK